MYTTDTEKQNIENKIKLLFDSILGQSKEHGFEIAPTLCMFSNIDGALAIKTMKQPKEQWDQVVHDSYKEYVNDTNQQVNGVILINEARMTLPTNQKDMAKVMHYLNTIGSLENCPYVKVQDVVICNYTLRDLSSNMFIVVVKENSNGTRDFEKFDLPKSDKMQGRLVDICQSLFYNKNSTVITD